MARPKPEVDPVYKAVRLLEKEYEVLRALKYKYRLTFTEVIAKLLAEGSLKA